MCFNVSKMGCIVVSVKFISLLCDIASQCIELRLLKASGGISLMLKYKDEC